VLIYLQDHNGEDGTGLRIVPGSHIRRDYDTAGNFGVKLEIGDVLIFDQRMTHRGAERVLGGDQRILVSFGYGLNNAFTDDFEEGTLMRQEVQRRMTSAYINSKSGDVTMDSITQFIRGHPVTPEMLKNKIAGNINGRICHHRINVL
jgi:hypothetical protein